jgi:probable biosynthetic protein (TIGR04098 family)
MSGDIVSETSGAPARGHKVRLSRGQRAKRLVLSVLDPRTYLHGLRVLNYYKALHVVPRRDIRMGADPQISPTVSFSEGHLIELGNRVHLNTRCSLWAGPTRGKITIGDDTLLAPEVFIITSNYRFNDGAPVNDQAMDEADVTIGRDVWIGAKCMILPGTTIGDGAIVAAGSVVRGNVPGMAIVSGNPAVVVGQRRTPGAVEQAVTLQPRPNPAVMPVVMREFPGLEAARLDGPVEDSGLDSFDLISLRLALETAAGRSIPDREWAASPRLADIARLPCLQGLDMTATPPAARTAPAPAPDTGTPAPSGNAVPAPAPRPAVKGRLERNLTLNMPQMALSGLSEAWLFKELGDMHWNLITNFLGLDSSRITDEGGDRLYATFTRFLLEVDPCLRDFSENAPLALSSQLSRFGGSLYLGDHDVTSDGARARAQTMSTFAKYGERGKNTSLMKGTPVIPDPDSVPSLSSFPDFSTEYRTRRGTLREDVLFECDYDMLAPHDINGVGLMYFAAYPTVFDLCIERMEGRGFLTAHSTMLKDICYFANSEPTETLVFKMHAREETDAGVRHVASLSRKSDGVRMGEVISEKRRL